MWNTLAENGRSDLVMPGSVVLMLVLSRPCNLNCIHVNRQTGRLNILTRLRTIFASIVLTVKTAADIGPMFVDGASSVS